MIELEAKYPCIFQKGGGLEAFGLENWTMTPMKSFFNENNWKSAEKLVCCKAWCGTICRDYGNGGRTDLAGMTSVFPSAIWPDCSLYDDAQPPLGALCNRQSPPQGYLSSYWLVSFCEPPHKKDLIELNERLCLLILLMWQSYMPCTCS